MFSDSSSLIYLKIRFDSNISNTVALVNQGSKALITVKINYNNKNRGLQQIYPEEIPSKLGVFKIILTYASNLRNSWSYNVCNVSSSTFKSCLFYLLSSTESIILLILYLFILQGKRISFHIYFLTIVVIILPLIPNKSCSSQKSVINHFNT